MVVHVNRCRIAPKEENKPRYNLRSATIACVSEKQVPNNKMAKWLTILTMGAYALTVKSHIQLTPSNAPNEIEFETSDKLAKNCRYEINCTEKNGFISSCTLGRRTPVCICKYLKADTAYRITTDHVCNKLVRIGNRIRSGAVIVEQKTTLYANTAVT